MRRGFQVFVSGIVLAGLALARAGVASAQEPAKPVLTLDGDAAIVLVLIKPDKAADFEAVVARYKEALGKNDNPKRKEQLAGITVLKSPTPIGGNTAYVFRVDPVLKGEEYDITRIIVEVFPSEATDMSNNRYKDAFAGRQIIPLNKLP